MAPCGVVPEIFLGCPVVAASGDAVCGVISGGCCARPVPMVRGLVARSGGVGSTWSSSPCKKGWAMVTASSRICNSTAFVGGLLVFCMEVCCLCYIFEKWCELQVWVDDVLVGDLGSPFRVVDVGEIARSMYRSRCIPVAGCHCL